MTRTFRTLALRAALFFGTLSALLLLAPREGACAPGPLQTGVMYWGSSGHRDQGGPFAAISIAQQAADLKNIFGSTPNTILYRAFGDQQSNAALATDVKAIQAQGIIPVVLVITYPPWTSFANEAAAYSWAYDAVRAVVQAAPSVGVYEIGNEWTLQSPIYSQWRASATSGTLPSHWKSLASYPLYRGAMAGAVAAIRDFSGGAQILGGPTNGWEQLGFVPALADDLVNYNGRNLVWDFTVCHWYDDSAAGPNRLGVPDRFSGGNAYALLRPASPAAQKPIIWSEFGSSNGNNAAYTDEATRKLIGLMDNFVAHKAGSPSELGVAGGIQFQLYQQPGAFTDLYLYTYSGGASAAIAPQGVAMKNWIAAHGGATPAPGGGTTGGGGVPEPTRTVVNETSPLVTYPVGVWWNHSAGFMESPTADATAELSFVGTGIEYHGKAASYLNGSIEVYIDGVLQTTLSNTQPGEDNEFLLYENQSLPHGPHTIRVRKVAGNWISVSKFEFAVASPAAVPALGQHAPGLLGIVLVVLAACLMLGAGNRRPSRLRAATSGAPDGGALLPCERVVCCAGGGHHLPTTLPPKTDVRIRRSGHQACHNRPD
jgi:hypothetical protein